MTRPPSHPTRSALAALRRSDPALSALMAMTPAFPGFPEPARTRRETHFCALARAILYQQLATKAAKTIHDRVVALTPGQRLPGPQQMLDLSHSAALTRAGVSGNKCRALEDLAARVLDGRLITSSLGRKQDEDVIAALVPVHGIGRWSAQMFLVFRLGRLDVMPEGDLAIQEGMRRLTGQDKRPSPAQVLARAQAWAPLRTVAAWHLWRATELPEPLRLDSRRP